jgi:hypothetical protein
MPIGQIHKDRFKKNALTLALVFGWVGFIWVITMIKMAHQ